MIILCAIIGCMLAGYPWAAVGLILLCMIDVAQAQWRARRASKEEL